MGSQQLSLSIQYAITILRQCRSTSTVMTRRLGKVLAQCWRSWKTKGFCFLARSTIACFLLSREALVSMATTRNSAGVRRLACDRVAPEEKKKAQICRLSLLNIVRCYDEWIGSLTIASHALTCNPIVRCYV